MKLLLAWVGFLLITFLLAVIGPPIIEFLNGYRLFRVGSHLILGLISLSFLLFISYVFVTDIYNGYKKNKKNKKNKK